MAKTKVKVVEDKVTKAKQAKRKTKGADFPWEVWSAAETASGSYHSHECSFQTKTGKAGAEQYIKENPDLLAPVIRHIHIPPMPY